MLLVVSYFFLVLLRFFLVFASISLGKVKNIQALVKFYRFLIVQLGCKATLQEIVYQTFKQVGLLDSEEKCETLSKQCFKSL